MNWKDALKAKAAVAWDFAKARFGGVLSTVLMVLAILALGSFLWNTFKPAPPPVNQWTPAPEIRTVEKIKRVHVPGPKQIVTIEKEKVVEKLKLPDDIAKNPNEQIIATAEIAPHRAKTDVVATMNTHTGEAHIVSRPRKPPFFEFISEKELGVRAGISTDGTAADVFARWDFVRIGGASIGFYGEAGATSMGKTQAKAQVSVSYKW